MDDFRIKIGAELDKSAGKQIQDGLNKVTPKPIEVPFKIDFKNSKEIENEMKRLVSKLTKGKGSLSDFKIDTSTIFDDDLGKRIEKLNGVTIKYKNELGEVISELYKFNQIGSNIDSSGQEEAIMGWSKAMSSYSQNTEKATNNLMRQKELVEQMKLLQIQADKSGITLNQDNLGGFDTANKNNNIKEMTHYLKLAKTEYSQLNVMMEKDLPISGLENMKKNIGTMPIDIQNVETSFKKLQVQPDELRTRIEQLGNSFKSLESFKGAEADKVKQYNLLKGEITGVTKEVKSLIAVQQQQISLDDKTKFSSSITSWSNDNTKGAKFFRIELERIQRELTTADKTKFTALKKEFGSIQKQTEAMGKSGRTAFQELGNNFQKFASWYGIAGITTSAVRGIKQMVSTVVELDKSLVDLQQATGFTAEETGKLLNTYIDLGQELGATGTEVAQAADVWLRQGKSIAETNDLIRNSMVLSKIGQIDSAQSTQYLTSAMKGYKVEVSDVLGIIDKLAAVDLNSATSVGGLAEAMSRTANGARIAGVEMDKLLGMLAVVGEVTQKSMDSVGESFKTIFARMGNVKLGKFVDEDGNDITTEINDVEKILNKVDIKLRDSATEFRNFGNVLDDVGNNWSKFNDVEQNTIASAFAGVRQRESIVTLFENYGDSLKYAEISANSAGTAMDKFSAYEESVEAKTKRLQTSLQELAVDTLDSSVVKGFLDLTNGIVKATTAVGGLVPVIITLGILLPTLKASFGTLNLSLIATQIQTFGLATAFKTLIGTITTFLATNPIGWVLALGTAIFGVKKIYDHFNVTLEEHQEILSQQAQAYDDATAKVKSLEGELESTRLKLEELNAIGGASVVKDGEQERLEAQTEELQRQLDIEKEKQRIAGENAEKEAIVSLTKTISSEFETYSDPSNRMGRITYDNVTRDVELQRIMDKYDKILGMQTELEKKQQELSNLKQGDSPEFEANEKQLESLATRMIELKTRANELVGELQNEKESLIGVTEEGDILKDLINGIIDVYRNWIGDSKDISDTNDDVVTTMSNTTTTLEAQNKAIDEYQKSITSIGKALSDLDKLSPSEIIDLMQQFPELAKYGFTGSEGIDALKLALEKVGTQLYNNLDPSLENIELFKQMYKEAMDASNSILTLSDALSKMNDSGKFLDDVKKEFKELGYISSETLNKIASKYPELESVIARFNAGLIDTTDILTELEKAYDIDFENYRTATIEKIGQNEEFFESIISNLPDWVKELADSYDIDYTNWKNLNSAKLEIYEEFKKKQARLDVMNNIFNQKGASGTISMFDVAEIQRMRKEVDEYEKIYNEVINSIGNNLDLKGYTPGKTGKSDPKWLTNFNDKKAFYKHQLEMDKISEADYYKKLEELMGEGLNQHKDKYLDLYRSNIEEIYKGRKKLEEDAIKREFIDLKYDLDIGNFGDGDVGERTYYKQLAKLNDNYYKDVEKYQDEYRANLLALNKWELEQDEKKFQEKIKLYDSNLSEIDRTINFVEPNSIEQITLLQTGYAQASEKVNFLNNEIEKLNKQYSKKIISEEIYTNRLETLTSQLYSTTSAMKSYSDSIISAMKARYDEQRKGLEELQKDELETLEKSHKTIIDNLEEQIKKYKDIVDEKKKSLRLTKEEHDYQKKLAEHTKSIEKLESRMAEIRKAASTGDRQAQAELRKLEDELAKEKEDLQETQYDREIELAENALDESYSAYEKMMKNQIDTQKSLYDSEKLQIESTYQTKLNKIEELYENERRLIIEAAELTGSEFSKAFDNINATLSQYGLSSSPSFQNAYTSTGSLMAGASVVSSILGERGSNMGQDTSKLSGLNKYLGSQGYNTITKKQMVEIAKALGVKGINSVEDVSDTPEGRINKYKILDELKKARFSKGGYVDFSSNTIKSLGEDGIALVKRGEPILTVEQGKLFKELINNIKPLNNLVKLSTPNISNIKNSSSSPVFNFNLNGGTITNDAMPQFNKWKTDIIDEIGKKLNGVVRLS